MRNPPYAMGDLFRRNDLSGIKSIVGEKVFELLPTADTFVPWSCTDFLKACTECEAFSEHARKDFNTLLQASEAIEQVH